MAGVNLRYSVNICRMKGQMTEGMDVKNQDKPWRQKAFSPSTFYAFGFCPLCFVFRSGALRPSSTWVETNRPATLSPFLFRKPGAQYSEDQGQRTGWCGHFGQLFQAFQRHSFTPKVFSFMSLKIVFLPGCGGSCL